MSNRPFSSASLSFIRHGFVTAWIACLFVLPAMAQQEVPALSDDEQKACDTIAEREVVADLTFLASDELEGRGTGSEGLRIANAYVASRFRAAGLVGPDPNNEDDFFQVHEIDMLLTSSTGLQLTDKDGKSFNVLGCLSSNETDINTKEGFGAYDPESDEVSDLSFSGPVVVNATSILSDERAANGQFAARLLSNTARRIARQGATAMIISVEADGSLAKFAQAQMDSPRMANPRGGSGIPVLLVEGDVDASKLGSCQIPGAQKIKQPVANVVGILHGSDAEMKGEAIIVSAHLDHLGARANGAEDGIYNGADDNASGVCGVLALAKAFAAMETAPKRTVIFAAFWGEERGLLGSRKMVENPVWPLDKTVANINIEMIGRPEAGANGKVWMTGWDQSNLGKLMGAGSQRLGVDIFEHPQFSNRLYRASDNWAFVQGGVIAHSFSAGSLHDDYHQPSDEWQKLNTRHMSIVCRGLFAGSLPIAQGQLTPKADDK